MLRHNDVFIIDIQEQGIEAKDKDILLESFEGLMCNTSSLVKKCNMIKVLFVCLGNICRSPMAQFVFKQMVAEKGWIDRFEIDSAATEGYNEMCHAGIHYGTREILSDMNIPFEEHYSRRIRRTDYEYFDYILAMDDSNIEDIQAKYFDSD